MSSKILSNPRNKKLTIIIVSLAFAMMLVPRDPEMLTGPAGEAIYQALFSGISFGMAIMLLVDLVRGFGDKPKSPEELKSEAA